MIDDRGSALLTLNMAAMFLLLIINLREVFFSMEHSAFPFYYSIFMSLAFVSIISVFLINRHYFSKFKKINSSHNKKKVEYFNVTVPVVIISIFNALTFTMLVLALSMMVVNATGTDNGVIKLLLAFIPVIPAIMIGLFFRKKVILSGKYDSKAKTNIMIFGTVIAVVIALIITFVLVSFVTKYL